MENIISKSQFYLLFLHLFYPTRNFILEELEAIDSLQFCQLDIRSEDVLSEASECTPDYFVGLGRKLINFSMFKGIWTCHFIMFAGFSNLLDVWEVMSAEQSNEDLIHVFCSIVRFVEDDNQLREVVQEVFHWIPVLEERDFAG